MKVYPTTFPPSFLPAPMRCQPIRKPWSIVATLALLLFGQMGCRNEQAPAPVVAPTATTLPSLEEPAEAPVAEAAATSPPDTGRVQTITFDDLKLEIEKGALFDESLLTPEIHGLIGQRISIRGFMYSTFQAQGIEEFVLLQRKDCPFGTPEAYVHHAIYVKLKEGVTTSFTRDPVTVEGVLALDPKKARRGTREFHMAIYRLDEAEVR